MRKAIILGITVLSLALVLSGCQNTAQDEQNTTNGKTLSGDITIAGSTSVQPLAEELAAAFTAKHPSVRIDIQGGGSSVGVQSANDGVADIGNSSRELKSSELSYNLHQHVIARDGIAMVVNPANKTGQITIEQIQKIFSGQIRNWKELGGEDAVITVVNREEGSGTRGAFEEIVMGDVKPTDDAIIQPSTGAVKQTVASDPYAIGYISMGALASDVKGLIVDGAHPTSDNVLNGSYKIARPFLMLTKEAPQGIVKAFLDFIFSPEGQEIVGQEFIKVK